MNGLVPSEKRKKLCDDFQEDPDCRVFISTDAGSTGLNLQAASLVINLDLPWNPAVLEQRIARIYRIGQKRSIQVINMVARDSFEERMLSTLNFKSSLFEGIFDGGDDTVVLDDSRLGKVLEGVSEYVDAPSETEPYDGSAETMEKDLTEKPVPEVGFGIMDPVEDSDVESGVGSEVIPEKEEAAVVYGVGNAEEAGAGGGAGENEPAEEGQRVGKVRPASPEVLVSQGVAFLSGLTETLRSEEGVRNLTETLVKTDPVSGKSELRIPVPDKETVAGILALFGKLLKG